MSLKGRVRKLLATAGLGEAERLRLHWERRAADRADVFDKLAAGVPDSHQERVAEALHPWAARLFDPRDPLCDRTDGTHGSGPRTVPAVVRWFNHTLDGFNAAAPRPVPAALLDVLLAHPEAELCGFGCDRNTGGCGVWLPGRPSRFLPNTAIYPNGPNRMTKWVCYFDRCPCCNHPTPQPHSLSGYLDDPLDQPVEATTP